MNQKQIDILLYIFYQEKLYLNTLISEFPAGKADIDFVLKNYCFITKKQQVILSANYNIIKVKNDTGKNKRALKRKLLYANYLDGDIVLINKFSQKVIQLLKRKYETISVYQKDEKIEIYNGNERLQPYQLKVCNKTILKNNTVYFARIINVINNTLFINVEKPLGQCNLLEVEINKLLFQNDIKTTFSKSLLDSIKLSASEISQVDRVDLTKMISFTIDNDDTKDIDDAISIKDCKNYYELFVHIADVSEYVKEKTITDKEASSRCFSIYPPNSVIPMLPPILSERYCSLTPEENKYCLTIKFNINKKSQNISFRIFESVIKASDNLSYSVVDNIINNQEQHHLKKEINDLYNCYKFVKNLPLFSQMLEFSSTEFSYNTLLHKVIINKRNESISSDIIEKMMVLSNYYVANFLKQNDVVFPYRCQEKPLLNKLIHCNNYLKQLHLPQFTDDEKTHLQTYHKILSKKVNTLDKMLFNEFLLQTQTKATYSLTPVSHYALSLSPYTHFTAPIRRYVDIIVHRLVKNILHHQQQTSLLKLKSSVSQINLQERKISSLERKMQLVLATSYYEKHPYNHKGVIANANSKGFYVMLSSGILGFVPATSFTEFLLYNSETGEFYNNNFSYCVGDKITVDFIGPNYLDLYLNFKVKNETNS